MTNGNSLGSWIDQERMDELLDEVRPGSLEREPSVATDEAHLQRGQRRDEPVESLLAEEIPERVFMKGLRPKLPPPEPRPPKVKPTEEEVEQEEAVAEPEPAPGAINPLNLYFHSTEATPEGRARAFVGWVRETADADRAFVVDAYGAAIASDPSADPVFLASLSNLADALGRGREHFSQPDQSALCLELSPGEFLSVMQAKWDVATIALGLVREHPLPREAAIRYREELAKLAQPARRRPRD